MHGRFLGPLIALMLWQSSVLAAPFAAPADRKRSIVVPKARGFRPGNIPQRPHKQEDRSQDVEFRGYFYLDGKPRFCIYNIDAQFSEWIALGEATYEEFNASGFDLDSETLTVTFKNQSFNLNLYGPTSSSTSAPPGRSVPPHTRTSRKSTSSSQPKRMPPVPKFVPQLPAAVTNSNRSTASSSRPQIPSVGKMAPPPPRSSFPVLPGSIIPRPLAGPSPKVATPSPAQPQSSNPVSAPATRFAPPPSSGLTNVPTTIPSTKANTGTGTEIDLSTLPPPPPPPNILPPSAPPDIEPSRDTE